MAKTKKTLDKPVNHLQDMNGSLWTIANEGITVNTQPDGELEDRLAGIENQLTILNQNISTMIELYAKVNADHIAQSEVLLKLKREA
jgi:hypothetical protein